MLSLGIFNLENFPHFWSFQDLKIFGPSGRFFSKAFSEFVHSFFNGNKSFFRSPTGVCLPHTIGISKPRKLSSFLEFSGSQNVRPFGPIFFQSFFRVFLTKTRVFSDLRPVMFDLEWAYFDLCCGGLEGKQRFTSWDTSGSDRSADVSQEVNRSLLLPT